MVSYVGTSVHTVDDFTTTVFPGLYINYQNLTGNFHTYKSLETVVDQEESVYFPTKFLNSLDLSGLPSHQLHIKIGALLILLRNLEQQRRRNGTWLVVKNVLPHFIEATIVTGCGIGDNVFIPRIPLHLQISNDPVS